ncbi:MAG: dTDP-4-dehydrorhamnose reductase [Pseudomonadales bacterium]|nr:dTDP-4-dehydrorhamnose reductase [Pseudomonadales bacterium]
MKILLTGGMDGQVGWEIIRLAKSTSHQLIPLTRDQLDITHEESIHKAIEHHSPDIVINAAAYTAVDKAEEDHEIAYKVNRDGTLFLAQACNKHGIPLLHISTDYVFDGEKSTPYEVDDAPAPQSVYGLSKWEGEEYLRNELSQHIILRTSWVFGRHGNNFVKTILRIGSDRDELKVVADQQGAPTSAHSIAACLLELCDRYEQDKNLPWGTYHFTGSPESTWFEFAQSIFSEGKKLGLLDHDVKVLPINTEDYPTLAKRPANSRLSMQLTKSRLKVETPNWKNDLVEVLQYLKG